MATVHLARVLGAVGFSRTVAIKRLHPHFAQDPQFVMMFVDEARVASRIRHPNVVPTLDVVSADGELFLVMEYVEGESLARLLRMLGKRQEHVPLDVACSVVAGALRGLHAAHEARDELGEPLEIVHRDVSPHNILVGIDGVARVVDFGVAKASGRLQTTREGQLKGKLAYMAPELFKGAAPERQVDIYAAAVTLWETLVGRRLFSGPTDAGTIGQIMAGQVQPAGSLVPGVPPALDAAILRGLSLSPRDRFGTAQEMAAALESAAPPAAAATVGAWVEAIVPDVLAERALQIAYIESDSARHQLPVGASAVRASLVSAHSGLERAVAATETSVSLTSDARRVRSRWRAATVIAVGAGAGIVAASAVLLLAPARRDAARDRAEVPAARATEVPSGIAPQPPPSASALGESAPSASAVVPSVDDQTQTPQAPKALPAPRPPHKGPVHFQHPD
jgi:serine/threonine-protein kinase